MSAKQKSPPPLEPRPAKTSENERKRNERKTKRESTRHGQTKGRRKRKGRREHMRKTKFIESTHFSRYQRITEETIAGNSLGSLRSFFLLPVFKAQETFGRKRLNPRFFCTTTKTEKK